MKKTSRTKKKDLTDPTYLDRLGTDSARRYAPLIKRQAAELGTTLPLDDVNVEKLLNNTIIGLDREGKLPWSNLPSERCGIFINAWVEEMNRQGIRG